VCKKPGSEGIFEAVKRSTFPFDPEDHRGFERIEIEKVSTDFHRGHRLRLRLGSQFRFGIRLRLISLNPTT
jgi:hypothetical protein